MRIGQYWILLGVGNLCNFMTLNRLNRQPRVVKSFNTLHPLLDVMWKVFLTFVELSVKDFNFAESPGLNRIFQFLNPSVSGMLNLYDFKDVSHFGNAALAVLQLIYY